MWAARVARWVRTADPPEPTVEDVPRVYKVVLVNETRQSFAHMLDEHVAATDDLQNIAKEALLRFCTHAPSWDPDDRVQAELRYTLGKRKYRAVLRSYMTPAEIENVLLRMRRSRDMGFCCRVGVRNATFLDRGHDDNEKEKEKGGRQEFVGEDVTARVAKYLGPNRDCHGVRIRVRDMFPRDDHAANAENCGSLCLRDEVGRVRHVPYMSESGIGTRPVFRL